MKTQTIKVEVPEGCMVKYDTATQTVKFVPEDYTVIKDFETAYQVLKMGGGIPLAIQADKQLCAMYKMQIVLRAVNRGYTFHLVTGPVWFPYVRFIGKDNVDKEIRHTESKILDFDYEGRIFTLVGGCAGTSAEEGLSGLNSLHVVGHCDASVSIFACHNRQIAHHVSKYFARLIFDCCFARELGFSLSDGERVTTLYPTND